MTLLAASICEDNMAAMIAAADAASNRGADAIELRIDALEGDPAKVAEFVKSRPGITWIITCRRAEEGGHDRGETRDRVARLIAAARGTGAYVDFEWAEWNRSSNIRQKILLAAAAPNGGAERLILSSHDFSGRPKNIETAVEEQLRAGPEVIAKMAYQGGNIHDSFEALDLLHQHGRRMVAICMGEDGIWTRFLAKKYSAFANYVAGESGKETAPGQPSLDETIHRYNWPKIDESTAVYGVVGDPVAHSLGPFLFNRWFEQTNTNALYLPLRVRGGEESFQRFMNECQQRPWLDVRGFSVTAPHKAAALNWVGNRADSLAQWVGAVNTICLDGGTARGFNTDCMAAVDSLVAAMGVTRADLRGITVDILGIGGAARGLMEVLPNLGCAVTVFGRSAERTGEVASQFCCHAGSWADRAKRGGDVLINCTPVGMWPKVEESPMPADVLEGCKIVFDLIYNPLNTRLLQDAKLRGCGTLNGLDMFVRQAVMQMELWTSHRPDVSEAHALLNEVLAR